jgi:mannitol/fructose-specific phosphotransferase system IIA component (Ntr-type)
MNIASRTPEGLPGRCPICNQEVVVDPSIPPGDATCPHCGSLLWIDADFGDEIETRRGLAGVSGPHAKPFLAMLAAVRDLVPRRAVVPNLETLNKSEAIRTLVKSLIAAEQVSRNDEDHVVAALLRREELGSTGIGRGVAIPHTKTGAVDRVVAAIGQSPDGLDFESLDGEPVHLMVLLLSPPDRPGDHLRALERVSRALRDIG